MVVHDLDARRTIESLRSGVPSDIAVQTLGTTQSGIERKFLEAIDNAGQGIGSAPLVIEANFGDGKSHLLNHLRAKAESKGYVTSLIVLGPETPIGNAHITLKAIAEEARAPGRTGKAVFELASSGTRTASAELRLWARDAEIHDRFRALLRVYEATQDDELRVLLLNDIEGRALVKTRIAQELRGLGDLSQYDLKSPRNQLLAHDRILVLAQFCKAHGCKGLVVFFDEIERLVKFPFKARLAAYQEIGWWREACEQASAPLFTVFAQTSGLIEQCLKDKGDDGRISSTLFGDERDDLSRSGIELLQEPTRLDKATKETLETLQYGVGGLYRNAYEFDPPPLPHRPAWTTIRSEIRRWITMWDLARHYPDYNSVIQEDEVRRDENEIPEELLSTHGDGAE